MGLTTAAHARGSFMLGYEPHDGPQGGGEGPLKLADKSNAIRGEYRRTL